MSLFANGFWIPSGVEFGTRFLATGLNLYDSLVATLICTLFSGIQVCMTRRIMQLHLRLSEKKGRSRKQFMQTLLLTGTSILFAVLFIISALIYCIQFSRNVLVLRTVMSSVAASADQPEMGESLLRCVEEVGRCIEVPMKNLYAVRRMELAYASIVQVLILFTDILLVVRCYFIFTDMPLVWGSAAASLVASICVAIFGLVSLSKAGGLSSRSSWNWSFADASMPRGYSPSMSIVSSLVVNIIVTASIVTRMLLTRRKLRGNVTAGTAGRSDDVYITASALLIESALPPVVFGIVAAVFSSEGVQGSRKAFEFELVPKVAWLAFTALAPQLLLVRILQGRAWKREQASNIGSSNVVLTASSRFSQATSAAPVSFSKSTETYIEEDVEQAKRIRTPLFRSDVSSHGRYRSEQNGS